MLQSLQRINGRWSVPMTSDRCDLICIDAPRAEAIRGRLLGDDTAQEAADRARALSDPTRLMLATALREGEELCVCDLSWIAGRSQNLVSHHLRALRDRGRSEEHTSELQSRQYLVCRLLLEKKKIPKN